MTKPICCDSPSMNIHIRISHTTTHIMTAGHCPSKTIVEQLCIISYMRNFCTVARTIAVFPHQIGLRSASEVGYDDQNQNMSANV